MKFNKINNYYNSSRYIFLFLVLFLLEVIESTSTTPKFALYRLYDNEDFGKCWIRIQYNEYMDIFQNDLPNKKDIQYRIDLLSKEYQLNIDIKSDSSFDYDQNFIFFSNDNKDTCQINADEANNSGSTMTSTPFTFTDCSIANKYFFTIRTINIQSNGDYKIKITTSLNDQCPTPNITTTNCTKLFYNTSSPHISSKSLPLVIFIDENGYDKPPPTGNIIVKKTNNGADYIIEIKDFDQNDNKSSKLVIINNNLFFKIILIIIIIFI